MTTLRDVVAELSEQLITRRARAELLGSLRDRSVVSKMVNLGGAAESRSARDQEEIRQAPLDGFRLGEVSGALEQTGIGLVDLYVHRRKRADATLWASLIAAAVVIVVVLVVVLITVLTVRSPGLIEAVCAGIPALLGGTFIVFYKLENDELRKIERDVMSVQQIARLLELTTTIENKTIRTAMYEKIVELIGLPLEERTA